MKFKNTIQNFTSRSNSKFFNYIETEIPHTKKKKRVKEKGTKILRKNHVLSSFSEFITSSNPRKNSES